jgi:hypothetical protein
MQTREKMQRKKSSGHRIATKTLHVDQEKNAMEKIIGTSHNNEDTHMWGQERPEGSESTLSSI